MAIKVEEVRIGNHFKCHDLPITVCEIKQDGFVCTYNDKLYFNMGDCEPIKLDNDILIKCGFEKHKNSNEYWNYWVLKNGWHISEWIQPNQMAGFEEQGVCYWGEEFNPVKYLHQLQNLFYALTNTEIEYKP